MSDQGDERHDQPGEIPAQREGAGPAPPSGSDPAGLGDLSARLGELQQRVELLGSQGVWAEGEPTPGPAEYTYGPGEHGEQPQHEAPRYGIPDPALGGYHQPPEEQPPAFVDPYAQPTPEWHGDQHPEPPAEEEIEEPYEQPTPAFPPPPVATNGHSHDHDEVSARSTTVALVDAGPFVDLIELRHFEDDLASLTAVRDVRVRRFGHGRASIEVGMTGPYALSRELYRLGRPMRVSDGDEGDLVIDLAPAPGEAEEATEEAQEPADEWTPGTPEAEG
ncbi:MAG: hypothetical protein KDB58_12820 [Solirubrobacterales bacterium]|nr:hypothetical protein [Solirubrobacterales bacterium]MCO5327304.1 hypothetical protein [Solirubrobacterales bacterium]